MIDVEAQASHCRMTCILLLTSKRRKYSSSTTVGRRFIGLIPGTTLRHAYAPQAHHVLKREEQRRTDILIIISTHLIYAATIIAGCHSK